jgi:hypothetical protein
MVAAELGRVAMITRRSAMLSPFVLMLLAREAAADEDVVFSLDMSGPRPTVMISINGQAPESWIFDTGAMGGVIAIDRATALGLANNGAARVGSPTGGTPVEGFRTAISGARIGGAVLPDFNATAMPLPQGLQQTGVLSPNIFHGRLVVFDFAHAQVRVTDRANAPADEPTPYTGSHPLPGLAVRVGEQSFDAHLDTGAQYMLSFPHSMAALLPLAAAPESAGTARFVDGERPVFRAQLRGAVEIGPLRVNDPEIRLIEALPYVNVGTEALRQMIVTLDPERRVNWVQLA